MRKRVAVAVSGGGRSLANLLACQKHHRFDVAAVIASNPTCGGVKIAQEARLPLLIEEFSAGRPDLAKVLGEWLARHRIDLVALAGFIRMFPSLPGWEQRVINIHPALLPKFGGRGMYGNRVHQAVIDAGEAFSGASIHFVNDRYDDGDVLAQVKIAVQPHWSVEELARQVFKAECQLYPAVLDDLVTAELPAPGGLKIYEF